MAPPMIPSPRRLPTSGTDCRVQHERRPTSGPLPRCACRPCEVGCSPAFPRMTAGPARNGSCALMDYSFGVALACLLLGTPSIATASVTVKEDRYLVPMSLPQHRETSCGTQAEHSLE